MYLNVGCWMLVFELERFGPYTYQKYIITVNMLRKSDRVDVIERIIEKGCFHAVRNIL